MNNQKGSILISLLLFIVVLAILSIGVYRISYSAGRQAQFSRDNSQAYYLAKAGADLIIDSIEQIIEEMEGSNKKNFEIEFPNEGKAVIILECENDSRKITINSTGVVNEGKGFESRSSIQARLKFDSIYGEVSILGVDEDGFIYEFDREFENPKIDIKDNDGNEIEIENPRAFAWNEEDVLVLITGEEGKDDDNSSGLIYKFNNNENEHWEKISPKSKPTGTGFEQVIYSKDKSTFYTIQSDNGKIASLKKENEEYKWEEIVKQGSNYKKIAQGNELIIGILDNKNKQIGIINLVEENKKWEDKTINENYRFNGITFGKKSNQDEGCFVIVGDINGNPVLLSSKNGEQWDTFIDDTINGSSNDITWTGEIFVAIGEKAVYISEDGSSWSKIDYNTGSYNFNMVSSYKDYIIVYGDNGALISSDGGNSWISKEVNDNFPKLRDIIVINKDYSKPDFTNPIIHWSK